MGETNDDGGSTRKKESSKSLYDDALSKAIHHFFNVSLSFLYRQFSLVRNEVWRSLKSERNTEEILIYFIIQAFSLIIRL